MKLLALTAIIALSSAAHSRTCKMELYGPYGEFITSVRTGNDDECVNAMQACRNWKVWYVAPMDSRCIRVVDNGFATIDYIRYPDYDSYYGYRGSPYSGVPRTQPTTTTTEICEYYYNGSVRCRTVPERRPNPNPTPSTPPVPVPSTTPGNDSIRAIEAGEIVIFNSALHMVVSIENTNFYNLKRVNGRNRDVIKEVARNYIAVTRGCSSGFCANDSVIVLASAKYAAIAGLEYDGQLILKTVDGNDELTFDMNPNALAWTKGCTPEGPAKVCVGGIVMRKRNNVYYTVVGIQLDGKVVLETNDTPKKITINVRPDSLLMTR
jgi:hypothetical protein